MSQGARTSLLLVLLVGLGCQSGPVIGRPDDWPPTPDWSEMEACFEEPEVRNYLSRLRGRVLRAWQLPRGVASAQRVSVGIILGEDGSLTRVAVLEASDRALAASVWDAVHAVPPEAPSAEAVCLVRWPIVGTFTNPEKPASPPESGP